MDAYQNQIVASLISYHLPINRFFSNLATHHDVCTFHVLPVVLLYTTFHTYLYSFQEAQSSQVTTHKYY